MGYLICDQCEGYYELQDGESPRDFKLSCDCGGKLNFYNNRDDFYIEKDKPKTESINKRSYAEKQSSFYNIIFISGVILSLVGIIGFFILNPLSLVLVVIGASMISYGHNEGTKWNKGIIGEINVANYLNQLPKDYHIFNDVKFPESYGNIDHIVIGPKGIFVIETKNYKGFYIVRGENWYYETRNSPKKSSSQPGKQVIRNAMTLRKFLIDNDINMDGTRIDSIVTLMKNNFTIERNPTNYNVLYPAYITDFIQLSDRKIDPNIQKKQLS
jgi:hypothetical protein